jgi:hypothetical protein
MPEGEARGTATFLGLAQLLKCACNNKMCRCFMGIMLQQGLGHCQRQFWLSLLQRLSGQLMCVTRGEMQNLR